MKKGLFAVFLCILMALLSACGNVGGTAVAKKATDWNDYTITVEGSNNTEDNPWGYTAGVIEGDDIGNCVLLTPNTSFTIKELDKYEVISLQAKLHPWVADSSDGVGIDMWVMNDNGDILEQDSIEITSEDSWVDIQYSVNDIENASQIKFLCNNGRNNDDSCDWVIFKVASNYLSDFGEGEYVRSATYFGEEWPINFWNSELETLDEDFQQISDDGFNSLIIVIPWKEFQTGVNPIEYSDYTFDNLDKVMTTADKYGLDVYTRIGYTWDFYNDSNESITERFLDIMRTQETHEAWLDYCRVMYEKLSAYPNFKDGFLTWEDFWGCLAICDNEDEAIRVGYAESVGYQTWVKDNYEIDSYNSEFDCKYASIAEIPVPRRTEPAMEAMYKFYDEYLNRILDETQEVFPNLSMEVRMDADLVTNSDGENEYYSHVATYRCENSDYTATMYGIPMGFENNGERVSSGEALKHTEYILGNLLNQNEGKPIYVEQFLFMDNTPQFSYNAQIKESEVGQYLEDVSDVLGEYTHGYGIWTYRDYRNNMLYNPQFALGKAGWTIQGEPNICESDNFNSWTCSLAEGDQLSQKIPYVRNHFPNEKYTLEFEVMECNEVVVEVSMGREKKEINIVNPGLYDVTFQLNDSFDFEFTVIQGSMEIDNMCLYSFVQGGHLYDEYNQEGEYIQNIRVLNGKLSNRK